MPNKTTDGRKRAHGYKFGVDGRPVRPDLKGLDPLLPIALIVSVGGWELTLNVQTWLSGGKLDGIGSIAVHSNGFVGLGFQPVGSVRGCGCEDCPETIVGMPLPTWAKEMVVDSGTLTAFEVSVAVSVIVNWAEFCE